MSDTPVILAYRDLRLRQLQRAAEKAHIAAAEQLCAAAGRDRIDAHVGVGENGLILRLVAQADDLALLPARPVAEVIEGNILPDEKAPSADNGTKSRTSSTGRYRPALERMHPAALRAEEEQPLQVLGEGLSLKAHGFFRWRS